MTYSSTSKEVWRVSQSIDNIHETDLLAVEEPLEIRLGFSENGKYSHRAVSITMRTPNHDFELAVGFLFTEGIIKSRQDVENVKFCGIGKGKENTVRVDLRAETKIDFKKLERHFYTTSSCGVCGKTSIAALDSGVCAIVESEFPQISAEVIHQLPQILRESQSLFEKTGGLHAAALFDTSGNLEIVREDVGRHNAVDKLIGAKFLENRQMLDNKILFVSGRASFELVQKALMAKIPLMAAVGAPSSLAVELAEKFGMTLLGFVRDQRFNIYCGRERIF